jgi:hypothetical protein
MGRKVDASRATNQEYLIKGNLLNYLGRIVLMRVRAQTQLQMIDRFQRNKKSRLLTQLAFFANHYGAE